MRKFSLAGIAVSILAASCIELPELLDTEPQTFTLEPATMHVARSVKHYRTGICSGISRAGGVSAIYANWVASLPIGADRAEVLVGRASRKHEGESCDTWVHSLFQGLVFFNVSRLPEGIVTDATIFFDRTPVSDPELPGDGCFFEVGAATEDARLRALSRVDIPQLSHGSDEDLITARDRWLIGARETSADVSRIVGRWDLGVYSDFGFAFTTFARDFAEVNVACAHRLDNFRLEVTLEVPVAS